MNIRIKGAIRKEKLTDIIVHETNKGFLEPDIIRVLGMNWTCRTNMIIRWRKGRLLRWSSNWSWILPLFFSYFRIWRSRRSLPRLNWVGRWRTSIWVRKTQELTTIYWLKAFLIKGRNGRKCLSPLTIWECVRMNKHSSCFPSGASEFIIFSRFGLHPNFCNTRMFVSKHKQYQYCVVIAVVLAMDGISNENWIVGLRGFLQT